MIKLTIQGNFLRIENNDPQREFYERDRLSFYYDSSKNRVRLFFNANQLALLDFATTLDQNDTAFTSLSSLVSFLSEATSDSVNSDVTSLTDGSFSSTISSSGGSSGGGGNSQPLLYVDAQDFDVFPEGALDSTNGIQAALNEADRQLQLFQDAGKSGRSVVRLAGGTYRITKQILIPNGCSLIGETYTPPYPNEDSGFGNNNNKYTGTEIRCDQNFDGENAFLLGADNTSIENMIIDGHAINNGTVWTTIIVRTPNGHRFTTSSIKIPVNDQDDPRIQGLAIDSIEVPFFLANQYMEYQLQAIGGVGGYTWSITNGALPAGLSLSADGLISGTPTTTELDNRFPTFTVTGDNGNGSSVSKVLPVSVILDEILTREFNPPTAGAAYSQQFESRHNFAGVQWQAIGLPDWLTLSSTGALTNSRVTTNDDVAFFDYKVILLDANGVVLDKRAMHSELRFDDGGIRIYDGGTLRPEATEAFSFFMQANGGYGDYTWSINVPRSTGGETNGANGGDGNRYPVTATSPYLGLTLNPATGEISGTIALDTLQGENIYFLRATSNVDNSIFFEGRFIINNQGIGRTPRVLSRSLKSANKGEPYSFQFNMVDRPQDGQYTYRAVNLPTGLTINSQTGLISGTPTGANFTNGVRVQWSGALRNLAIRGFDAGAGVYSFLPSNIHRFDRLMISACDQGIYFQNQTFDSHFTDMYIFNCRVGMDLGAGAAGLTTTDTRIEFIHEDGVRMNTSHENDFNGVYFDTCGWSSVAAVNSRNACFTGCRFYRSGRLLRGTGTQLNTKANTRYSNHFYLEDCERWTITGNTFDIGSRDAGDQVFLEDNPYDCLRPNVGLKFKNSKELIIVGNNITGCITDAFDADLDLFGENTFKGYRISDNAQTDSELVPIDEKIEKQKMHVPNQSFKVWQRDNAFNIPAGASQAFFPVADFWGIDRSANTIIDQAISVTRRQDGIKETDGYYLKIEKDANTPTDPVTLNQTLELVNRFVTDVAYTSNKSAVVSFWARSGTATTVNLRLALSADAPENSFASDVYTAANTTLSTQWKRYSFVFNFKSLEGLTLGDNKRFVMALTMPIFNQAIDVDVTGFQVDFKLQTPFAQKLRSDSFEFALSEAKTKYQKSKAYDQYHPSWSATLRYDVNGANFQPGYVVAYPAIGDGAAMRADVVFDQLIEINPGFADQQNGVIDGIKILNPNRLTSRTDAIKYSFNSTASDPLAYIEQVSQKHFTVSARNETIPTGENYIFHWIYTNYDTDTAASGGYA